MKLNDSYGEVTHGQCTLNNHILQIKLIFFLVSALGKTASI